MGRRILNRKELRADFDAAEQRTNEEEREDEDEEGEDEDEDEEGDDEEEGEEGDEDEEPSDEDDEDAPKKKKKKKAAPKAKAPAKPRTRAVKVVRMRAIWGVFDNSNKMVANYEYPKRAEADAHATRLTADKRSTHFVQMVKEPIEEEKKK